MWRVLRKQELSVQCANNILGGRTASSLGSEVTDEATLVVGPRPVRVEGGVDVGGRNGK